jgi:competence protein ComEC
MRLLNFNIIKLFVCLALGIISGHWLRLDTNLVIYTSVVLVIATGIYWFTLHNKIVKAPYFGLLIYVCMFSLGISGYAVRNDKKRPNHYTNLKPNGGAQEFVLQINERLKPDNYNYKYIVDVLTFNNQKAEGRLLINIRKDSLFHGFNVDDTFYTLAPLEEIRKPLNPHQFDYSKYLELKQVYHQLYLEQQSLSLLNENSITIYGYADRLRTIINTNLKAAGFEPNTLNIINALLLGQRQDIDEDTYNNYVNSGTIHILAVSGLHVGIILLILNVLLKPVLYIKYGRIIRPVIIVAMLWAFAIVAGLSPSVTRAVTMFSIISMAMHLKRPTNIYNTLVISAFVILLFKPSFLFEVGFQMSYLAVLGIVSIQPILYKGLVFNYWIPDKLWQIFTVTIAAQFGVAPIGLYYFHQFPGLFFISNLVVIPFLGLILGFGLLIIGLALLNALPRVLVTAYSGIIEGLNTFISWIAQFENFLLRDIPFSLLQVLLSYLIIIALVQTYRFKNFRWLAFGLVGIICFQSLGLIQKFENKKEGFIIFNKSRYTLIGQRSGNYLKVDHNLDSLHLKKDRVIENYKLGEGIKTVFQDSLEMVYKYKAHTLLVMDSLGIYKGLSFKPDFVLLRNSPKINLNRLLDSLRPQTIIADGSNYKSYVRRWKQTCSEKNIPFYPTNEKGAFILE